MADLTAYVLPATIQLELAATSKEAALNELVGLFRDAGVLVDEAAFTSAVLAREAHSSTGLGDGIAIPHGKSDGIGTPTVAFARSKTGIDWGSPDGTPAHLFFLIGVPEAMSGNEHLVILSRLARNLVKKDFRDGLQTAKSIDDVQAVFTQVTM